MQARMNTIGAICFFLSCVGSTTLLGQEPAILIDQISIAGNQRIPDSTVDYYIQAMSGTRYDARQVYLDYSRLLETGFFSDVEVTTTPGPNGMSVRFQLTERPLIRSIGFEGLPASETLTAEAFRVWLLETESGVTVDAPFVEERLGKASQALSLLLAEAGMGGIQVDVDVVPITPHSVSLNFKVSP